MRDGKIAGDVRSRPRLLRRRREGFRVFALVGLLSGLLAVPVAAWATAAATGVEREPGARKGGELRKPAQLPDASARVPTLDSIIYDRKDFSDVNTAKPLLKLHYQSLSGSLGRSTKPGGK